MISAANADLICSAEFDTAHTILSLKHLRRPPSYKWNQPTRPMRYSIISILSVLPALTVSDVCKYSFAVVRARGEDIRPFRVYINGPHPLLVPVDRIAHGVLVRQIESPNTAVIRRNQKLVSRGAEQQARYLLNYRIKLFPC